MLFLKNSFFPSVIIGWNNLRNSDTYGTFKNAILKFIRPSPNSVFECHNPEGIKFLRRLRLGLRHHREHKFKHSFQDSMNQLRKCGAEVESTSHFLSYCPFTMIGPPSLALLLLEILIVNYYKLPTLR